MGCHFLLQGIFLTQESNPGLLHCSQMMYQLSYEGSYEGVVGKHFSSVSANEYNAEQNQVRVSQRHQWRRKQDGLGEREVALQWEKEKIWAWDGRSSVLTSHQDKACFTWMKSYGQGK